MIERWNIHPSIPIGLGILVLAYALGAGPLRRRGRLGPPVDRLRAATFGLGIVSFFLALTGPIHDLSDSYLFSVHMLQHLIITLVAPPLVLLGTPGWMIRPLLRLRAVNGVFRLLTRAPVAYILFSGMLAVWHVPRFYGETLIDLPTHIFEHLLFIAAAFIAWWPVLSPIGEMRLRPPLQVFYLILLTLPMKGLGAALTMQGDVLYPAYALAPRVYGISPMEDQKIGGLLMWLPSGSVLWGAAAIVFYRWWRKDQETEAAETQARERSAEASAVKPA